MTNLQRLKKSVLSVMDPSDPEHEGDAPELVEDRDRVRAATTIREVIEILAELCWDIDSVIEALLATLGVKDDPDWELPHFDT